MKQVCLFPPAIRGKAASIQIICNSLWRLVALIVLLAAVPLAMAQVTAPTKVLFEDDFEIGSADKWQYRSASGSGSFGVCGAAGAQAPCPITPHSGRYSFVSSVADGSGYRYQQVYYSFLDANDGPITASSVFVRLFFYIPSSYSIGNGAEVQIAWLNNRTSGALGIERVVLRKNGTNLYLKTANTALGSTPVTTDTWHSVELAYQGGSGTGSVSLYLDGAAAPEVSATGLSLPLDISQLRIGQLAGVTGVAGPIYTDDVVLSSTRIGAPAVNIKVRHPDPYGHSAMKLHHTLWGYTSTDQLVVTVDGRETYRKSGNIEGFEYVTLALTPLAVGDHSLTVQLLDSNGAQKASASEIIHKYVAGTPTVSIDENNSMSHNGVLVFPITPFVQNPVGSPDGWNVYSAAHYVNMYGWMAGYSDAGYSPSQYGAFINAIGAPAIGPDQRSGPVTWASYGGVDCTVTANQYKFPCFPINMPSATTMVAGYVNALKSSPYVFGWNWQDEPDSGGNVPRVLPAALLAAKAAVYQNDGNHLTFQNLYGYSPTSSPADAGKGSLWKGFHYPNLVADVYAFDNYIYIYQEGASSPTVAGWVDEIDRYQSYNFGLTPWMVFVEIGVQPCPDPPTCTGGHGTNAEQLRMEAWLAVIHGVKGISWWGPETPQYTYVSDENHAAMARFVDQMGRLKDMVLGAPSPRTLTNSSTSPGSRVDVMLREDQNAVYVFAARLTDDLADASEATAPALTTQLSISGVGTATATLIDEDRSVAVSAGTFADLFKPYDVHIYRIPKGPAPAAPTVLRSVAK